jgi:hypothetical protein
MFSNSLVTQTRARQKLDCLGRVHIRDPTLSSFVHHIYHPSFIALMPFIQIIPIYAAWSLRQGPYIITTIYDTKAYQLPTPEGEPLLDPINSLHLCKFYI